MAPKGAAIGRGRKKRRERVFNSMKSAQVFSGVVFHILSVQ